MADFFESAINNYSGLSTETKPTTAAGNNVPNGSRWREVDRLGRLFHYNKSDDTWYMTEVEDGTIVFPAKIGIDIFHYAIHAGLGFYRTVYSADISGSELTMAFKTPAVATAQIHVLAHFTASAGALVTIYEGGDLAVSNAGDDVAPINRRRSGTPPNSLMSGYDTGAWIANRVTVNGVLSQTTATVLDELPVGAGRKEGGGHDASWELVLASETVYGIHFDDLSAAANVAHMTVNWFEIPP